MTHRVPVAPFTKTEKTSKRSDMWTVVRGGGDAKLLVAGTTSRGRGRVNFKRSALGNLAPWQGGVAGRRAMSNDPRAMCRPLILPEVRVLVHRYAFSFTSSRLWRFPVVVHRMGLAPLSAVAQPRNLDASPTPASLFFRPPMSGIPQHYYHAPLFRRSTRVRSTRVRG